jgi:hypothetical protein
MWEGGVGRVDVGGWVGAGWGGGVWMWVSGDGWVCAIRNARASERGIELVCWNQELYTIYHSWCVSSL